MSHFTVTVRVPPIAAADKMGQADLMAAVRSEVERMLAPYQENNMGDCPREFLEFNDAEDDLLREWESGEGAEMVRCPDGSLVYPWDERLRVPGTFGTGTGTHSVPPGHELVNVPFRDRYATFEQFAREWHGYGERDSESGRYGRWENPNKKWDWWTIGGRWTGHFPLKPGTELRLGDSGAFGNAPTPGHADIVRVGEIDMDAVATKTRESAEKFWGEWAYFLEHKRERDRASFHGSRGRAMDIGLLRVSRDPSEEDKRNGWRWGDYPDTYRHSPDQWDVLARPNLSRDDFMRDYIDCFCPIKTYAALDAEGWHAPGEMGWFGCSNDTPDSYVTFAREFVKRFIKAANPDEFLVVVDCHI